MTRSQVREYQLARLNHLLIHAKNTVPHYKDINIVASLEDLKKIPVLDKKTILSDINRLRSTKNYRTIKDKSGGSTGNKVTVYKDLRYHAISKAVLMRDWQSAGVEIGAKSAWFSGDIYKNKPVIFRMFYALLDRINRKIVLDTFQYKEADIIDWFQNKYNKFKPDYLFGFGGTLYDIAKLIKEKKIPIHKPKLIISSSERLEKRKYIEGVFGCQVIDQYGATEIPAIAIEDKNYVMHSSDDFVIVEVFNGEVLITALESYAMPLIRYKLGDIGLIEKKSLTDTYPFKQFNITIGRTYEVMKNRKGEHISGGLIKTQVEDEDLDINEFQVVQKSLDEVDLNIVKDEFTKEDSVKRLVEILKFFLDCDKVNVHYLDKFPTESNGKRIAFKCLI
ncbi:phenylacetate--CoA ligase family protein [Candidatus Woesearchaeota archaeon]|nr:phenylacetate--CoA ligase family protein [Candidatus Woesearchaeota archaeon]